MTVAPRIAGWVVAATLALAACGSADDGSTVSTEPPDPVIELPAAVEQTVLGQPIVYPTDGAAELTVDVVTLQPGDETGWHHHNTPMVGYILDGRLTVDYGDDGSRTYEKGEAIIEAIDTSHNGQAIGDDPTRILVVNIGASGIENTAAD
ncbi:cupin domain-containing protein [Ilumatobacter sp.]|uniref:cupin domain-containing protein n=1 Tax=Ilumatobacter sp. TaxID=1967498 RepID=UPI003C43E259